MRVHPTLIPADRLIANVNGVMNAVMVNGEAALIRSRPEGVFWREDRRSSSSSIRSTTPPDGMKKPRIAEYTPISRA